MSEPKESAANDDNGKLNVYRSHDVAAFFGVAGDTHLATFDPKTPEGAAMLVQAAMDKCIPMKDTLNTEITLQHIYAHPASRIDPNTHEVFSWLRIVLITTDNQFIECGSEGVKKSIGLIAQIFGNPPWPNGIKVKVKADSLGGGKQFYKLIPVLDHIKRGQGGRTK